VPPRILPLDEVAMSSDPVKRRKSAAPEAFFRRIISAQKSRRKPGPVRELTRSDLGLAFSLRRYGASLKTVLAKVNTKREERSEPGISMRTLSRGLARFRVLARRRESPVITMLEETRGAQRLDLSRLILDLDELAALPELERTIEKLEKIRGVEFHRNQLARMREWCARVGIELAKVEEDGEEARLVLDVKALRRVLTPKVVEIACAIRLAWQAREARNGSRLEER
jgi:hypothetical protein